MDHPYFIGPARRINVTRPTACCAEPAILRRSDGYAIRLRVQADPGRVLEIVLDDATIIRLAQFVRTIRKAEARGQEP